MRKLGSQENPCRNNYEIDKIIRGMFNCRIYALNTFEISDENLQQAKARNIVFVGLAGAYWKTPALPKAQAEIINPTNIAEIKVDKDTKIPIDLDGIKKQIVKQFNVAAGVFECEISAITRQFEMTQEQYKNKYLGRW